MSTLLQDKTALVTGGSRGIGRCIADTFISEGATVITCGRGQRPGDLQKEIRWIVCDVANPIAVADMAAYVSGEYGDLSVLVNNAGMQIEKTILDTSDDDWDALMGVNTRGVFQCCRAFIPQMQVGGSIINIGSISGRVADPALALYNASKAFVHGLTRSIAVDHGATVRCNAILPGWIMTEMADAAFALADNPQKAKNDALARHPVGRFGHPQDIANMALWLASDASEFANGQCFTVDGGMTAASPLNPGLS
jgi:meso-butanediol dehydrogenase/(S,S)-butanediol dehydrogenase/diacetyl reductase